MYVFASHRLRWWLLCLCLSAEAAFARFVAWDDDTAGGWFSRQSEHFEIIYSRDLQSMAQRSLEIAEQVHKELVPFFSVYGRPATLPSERTRLVLVDDYDVSNGWATPFPFAQIRLFASPPQDINSLENNDSWLHTLIRHEYVHVLHMQMARQLTKKGRRVFGNSPFSVFPFTFFPHALTPSMMLEGLAVYLEGNAEYGYGRLHGSYYAMQMRTEVAFDRLKPMSKVVISSKDWPLNTAYLYGAYFTQFLVEHYGEDKLRQYLYAYSGQLIPFFMQQRGARSVFGKSFSQLWLEFQQDLKKRFQQQIEQIRSYPQPPGRTALLDQPRFLPPVMSSNESGLVWVNNDGKSRQFVSHLKFGQSLQNEPEPLFDSKGIVAVDVNRQGTIAVSRRIPYADGRVYNDVFIYDAAQGWQQVTYRQRFRKMRWLTDNSLIASRSHKGLSELYRLDLNPDLTLKSSALIWRGEEEWVLGDFSINAATRQIVAMLKRPQQSWNLEMAGLASHTFSWRPITNSAAVENSPRFVDADTIVFSADYDGVFNIHQLSIASGKREQLTHVMGGAFNPQLINGRLFYSEYVEKGYQIMGQPDGKPPEDQQTMAVEAGRHYPIVGNPLGNLEQAQVYGLKSRSFWKSIRPHLWVPYFLKDDKSERLGLVTFGQDALGRHNYQLLLNKDTRQNQFNWSVTYQYDNRWLLFHSRDHRQLANSHDFSRRDERWLLQRSLLLTAFEDQLSTHLGVINKRLTVLETDISAKEILAGAALTFNNRESFLRVPGVAWGTYADLVFESYDVADNKFHGHRLQTRFSYTFDLPGDTALTYQGMAGYSSSKAKQFVLGGITGDSRMLFGRSNISLRGYARDVQSGHRYIKHTLSLKQPLAEVGRNWSLNPVGVGDIWANLYADSGQAMKEQQSRSWLNSVGVEVTAQIILGYRMSAPLTMGFAKGLNAVNGRTEYAYATLGLAF